MSNMVRCSRKQHVYDAEKYAVCPYCGTMDVARASDMDQQSETGKGGTEDWSPPVTPIDAKKRKAPVFGAKTIYAGQMEGRRAVFGWFVVATGRGKGASFEVYSGLNKIGRSAGEVTLDFGDEAITSVEHARLLVDPQALRFAIQHGEGKNLTYVNQTAVFASYVELHAYDRVQIGGTELIFVPFCNEQFKWEA